MPVGALVSTTSKLAARPPSVTESMVGVTVPPGTPPLFVALFTVEAFDDELSSRLSLSESPHLQQNNATLKNRKAVRIWFTPWVSDRTAIACITDDGRRVALLEHYAVSRYRCDVR